MIKSCIIIIDILFIIGTLFLIAARKNNNAFDNCVIIIKAIYRYKNDLIENGNLDDSAVDYTDMRSYESVFLRIWDWGYKNILPKDKFEIIKPYIKEEQK